MNEISSAQLLNQIRTLGKSLQVPPGELAGSAPRADFSTLLGDTLNAVNNAQQLSNRLKSGFENGTGSASLAEVMIAGQKADISFRAVTEVRNKLVQAYQDIMNMPV